MHSAFSGKHMQKFTMMKAAADSYYYTIIELSVSFLIGRKGTMNF